MFSFVSDTCFGDYPFDNVSNIENSNRDYDIIRVMMAEMLLVKMVAAVSPTLFFVSTVVSQHQPFDVLPMLMFLCCSLSPSRKHKEQKSTSFQPQ